MSSAEKVLNEYIYLGDDHIHFAGREPSIPLVRLCYKNLILRANSSWSELPLHLKETTVAHELGHREMGHASIPQHNLFFGAWVHMYGTANPKELEADRYACKLVGINKYIIGLRGMVSINRKLQAHSSVISEYEYRIRALEGKLS